jgi:HK97 family phage major capsid protein
MTTIGQQFAASKALVKGLGRGEAGPVLELRDADLKTLMTTSAGFAPDVVRDPLIVPSATRPLSLLDFVLQRPTTANNAFPYMEETGYTNAAAETSEGGTYGEAALTFTERTASIGKISVFLPATDEVLEDGDNLAAYVDARLGFMLRQRLELQMLVGNGTSPNLRGIVNVAGVQSQAKGADSAAVAIRKAKTKVRVPGYGQPDLVVMHPTNSEGLDTTAAADQMAAFRLSSNVWDMPRLENDGLTLGTAIVGDFTNFTALRIRRGVTLQVTNSHSTFFIEGKQAIRADMRVAFPIYRPAAFCLVTGL